MCLESGDGSGTLCNWSQRVPDSWTGAITLNAFEWKFIDVGS